MLFPKYVRNNVGATNFLSNFSTFVPTKNNTKLVNGNTVNDQGICIILCCFKNCHIIYPVGIVYYCPGHQSNTISLVALKFMLIFKRLSLDLYKFFLLWTFNLVLGSHHTGPPKMWTIFKLRFVKVKPKRNKDIVVPTVYDLYWRTFLDLSINALVKSLLSG